MESITKWFTLPFPTVCFGISWYTFWGIDLKLVTATIKRFNIYFDQMAVNEICKTSNSEDTNGRTFRMLLAAITPLHICPYAKFPLIHRIVFTCWGPGAGLLFIEHIKEFSWEQGFFFFYFQFSFKNICSDPILESPLKFLDLNSILHPGYHSKCTVDTMGLFSKRWHLVFYITYNIRNLEVSKQDTKVL